MDHRPNSASPHGFSRRRSRCFASTCHHVWSNVVRLEAFVTALVCVLALLVSAWFMALRVLQGAVRGSSATGSSLWVVPCSALIALSTAEWALSFCAACWAYGAWYRRFPPTAV